MLGQGNISCSLWLEGRQTDSPSSASRTGWILGFMSAFNQYGLQSQGTDVSEGKNTDELMGWVDNYCRQHQGDDLHTASEAGRRLEQKVEPEQSIGRRARRTRLTLAWRAACAFLRSHGFGK